MIYEVKYHSVNKYEEPVSEALFEFLVFPNTNSSQTLLDYKIRSSSGEEHFFSSNSLGFKAIRVRVNKKFKEFEFSFSSRVEKLADEPMRINPLAIIQQTSILLSENFFIDHHIFLSNTRFTALSEKNKDALLLYDGQKNIVEYLVDLNRYLHTYLSYQPNSTSVDTTANDALEMKKGVCQDYTHLFIAIARKSRIPARYVSGYLNQGQNFIGSAMMHAWAEAFVPGLGWIGFDPTNNLQTNEHYIKVCHGKDYLDCTPIKGVLRTKGDNSTHHSVEVSQQ